MTRSLLLRAFACALCLTAAEAVPASAREVIDLGAHPGTCIRLDRPVTYVGHPRADQNCPAHIVGRRRATLRGGLHAGPRAGGPSAASDATAHAASAVYTGKGFDPCAAPSPSTMSAWSASPYRAIGIYVGGEDMGCAQPNLTATWIATEVAAGWHLIPTYVGKQGPGNSCGCSTISSSQAAAQGRAAADDAVGNVAGLGIGAGNPVYYDMEAYSRGGSNTTTVLTFLSAWTARLHSHGYLSGVYSSGASGITDLVNSYSSHTYTRPDELWIADWNGQATTSDPYVPSSDWSQHQRIHQYRGGHNETYGGRTLNIDNDYLDGATADSGAPSQPTGPTTACVVPKLRRMNYRQAKHALRLAHCALGHVHWPHNWRRHRHHLRVFSQTPKGGSTRPSDYGVAIRLSYRPF